MISLLFTLLASLATAYSAPTDTVAYGSITRYTINGSGCPPGSVSASLSSNTTSITAVFSQFDPSVSTADFRENCQATIEVDGQAGKQFTVNRVNYDGYAQLDSGVSAVHESTYYFQGQTRQNTASATLSGPINNHVDLSNFFGNSAPIYSACGQDSIVNIDISVFITASSNANGFVAVDSARFGPFTWRDC